MQITIWPLVPRDRLVWAFRPGEPGSSEGPFRTLRKHGWATAGVRITPRTAGRTTGRVTVFSMLNLEAARLARLADAESAERAARSAAVVEASRAFVSLGKILAHWPALSVAALSQGIVPAEAPDELWTALRRLAEETQRRWRSASARGPMPEIITGCITEIGPAVVVLQPSAGPAITLPRWLAQAAHRESVGACLGVVVDRFEGTSALTYALPALDLDARPRRFSPFDRDAPIRSLTPDDVALLRREPEPLRVIVPVTIGG
jgi:hypothetical protein